MSCVDNLSKPRIRQKAFRRFSTTGIIDGNLYVYPGEGIFTKRRAIPALS